MQAKLNSATGSRLVLAAIAAFAASVVSTTNAAVLTYTATLTGLAEEPPVITTGSGFSTVTIDTVAHTMRVQVDFSNLIGTTTVCHIHAPTLVAGSGVIGVATTTPTFAGFPAGVTSGSFDSTLDLTLASSYNPSFVTNRGGGTIAGAEAALLQFIAEGRAYVNVHSSFRTGGEIRGFLVPAPGALALLGLGGLFAARRNRR